MELIAIAMTIGATFCWGTSQVIGKVALRRINTLVFNNIRYSVALIPVSLAAVFFGSVGEIGFGLPALSAIASGIFGWFIASSVFFFVLKRDSAHRIIPSGNSYPFWAILLGALLLDETITWIIPISATLVFLGTFLLGRSRSEDDKGTTWKYGVPLASIVAFLWGLNAVLIKFALNGGLSRLSVLLLRVISASGLFWITFLIRRKNFNFPKKNIGLSAISGLIAFPVGSLLYISALTMEEASTLAPVTGGTILFGFLLSITFLDETPTKKAVIGMTSILGGIILMTL